MLTLDTNFVNQINFQAVLLAQQIAKQMKRIACKELDFFEN